MSRRISSIMTWLILLVGYKSICQTVSSAASAPIQSQTKTQPLGPVELAADLRGILNEETFPGSTVAQRVRAAMTYCGSDVCTITIPSYAPAGLISESTLPDNVVLKDLRFFHGVGFAMGSNEVGAPHLFSAFNFQTFQAGNQSWDKVGDGSGTFTMDLEAHAVGGGFAHDATRANSGALLLYSERTGGSRPNWGVDINTQYSNLNNTSYAIEVDEVNNSDADDPGDGTVGDGIQLIASSNTGKKTGVGLFISGSNTQWQNGIDVVSYANTGLLLTSSRSKVSDIRIGLPDADPKKASIVLTTSTIANAQAAIFDDGSAKFNHLTSRGNVSVGGGLAAKSVTAANGFTGTKKAGPCVFHIEHGIIIDVTGC